MNAPTQAVQIGKWKLLSLLGKGGQGEVHTVEEVDRNLPDARNVLSRVLHQIAHAYNVEARRPLVDEFLSVIESLSANKDKRLGAMKRLHRIADPTVAAKAAARMERELAAMSDVSHPSLVRILDANEREKWFVMEFHQRGTLSGHLGRTRGQLLEALQIFKPLAEAVAALHSKGYVHRDIKPDNIFVGDDGRLVLGDFGLIINADPEASRLTDIYENVGSKEWMPGWALGMRIDDIRPTFDVFCLGKTLWAMLSGRPFMRLWYYDRPEFDLTRLFSADASMCLANALLRKTIVEHEKDCLPSAQDMLTLIDEAIAALKSGGQFLRPNVPFRCRICGFGQCSPSVPEDASDMHVFCSHCGHMEVFKNPRQWPAWQ